MTATTAKCIRCHPAQPGDIPLTGRARFICDDCMQKVNHPFMYLYEINMPNRPHPSPSTPPATPPTADGRKSSRNRGRKTKAVATALVLMLLPFLGCTLHRETTLDVTFSPASTAPTLEPLAKEP